MTEADISAETLDLTNVGTYLDGTIGPMEVVTLRPNPKDDGPPTRFVGVLLGKGSTQRTTHLDHPVGSFPVKGKPCSGCRWAEAYILFSDTHNQYVIQTVGRTIVKGQINVPDEVDFVRTVWCERALEVLNELLLSPKRNSGRDPNSRELPPAARDALEQASSKDMDISNALDTWDNLTEGQNRVSYNGRR